jgi:hypothetical protein
METLSNGKTIGSNVEVHNDSFMVCGDCLMAIVNGDFTGLDHYLDEPVATIRMEHIKQSIQDTEGHIVLGNSEEDLEFSPSPCDCCRERSAGSRHHCVTLIYNSN